MQSQSQASPSFGASYNNYHQPDDSPYISVKYRTSTPASSPLNVPISSTTAQRSRSNSQTSSLSGSRVISANPVSSPLTNLHQSSLSSNSIPELHPLSIIEGPDDCDVLLNTSRWNLDDSRKPASKRRKRVSAGWATHCPTFSSGTLIADARAWFKELSSDTREKLLFILSSMLGTCLFLLLFEAMLTMTAYDLEDSKASVAIVTCYVLSYLISILWQSAFYRILVYSAEPFCWQLINTYVSYSISLICVTVIGYVAIHLLSLSPRLVALALMPANAAINFYLLRLCSAGNSIDNGSDNDADESNDNNYSALYPHTNPFQLAQALSSSSPRSKGLIV